MISFAYFRHKEAGEGGGGGGGRGMASRLVNEGKEAESDAAAA